MRFFDAKHPTQTNTPGIGINPNSYYDNSRKFYDPTFGSTDKKQQRPKIEYETEKKNN